jgi:hypothetical protein
MDIFEFLHQFKTERGPTGFALCILLGFLKGLAGCCCG